MVNGVVLQKPKGR